MEKIIRIVNPGAREVPNLYTKTGFRTDMYLKSNTKEIEIDEMANRIGSKLSGLPERFMSPLEVCIKEVIEQHLQEVIDGK